MIDGGTVKDEIESSLASIERELQLFIEGLGMRPALKMLLDHFIITGNVAYQLDVDGESEVLRVFPLRSFVVDRDPMGGLDEAIICELISPLKIPKGLRNLLPNDNSMAVAGGPDGNVQSGGRPPLKLYTHITWDEKNGVYVKVQEFADKIVPGTRRVYKPEVLPYRFMRGSKEPNSPYGRGIGELVLGDLQTLENIHRSMSDLGALMSRSLVMVSPNGMTDKKKVASAPNGDVITGHSDDVTVLQAEKSRDMQMLMSLAQVIEGRLSTYFLMHNPRHAERVTAEEIRVNQQELQQLLGDTYDILETEFQRPLVEISLEAIGRSAQIPQEVVPIVITGAEALGRGQDFNRLSAFMQTATTTLGPEALQFINLPTALRRLAVGAGVEEDGLIKTAQQIAEERQAAQEQAQQQAVIEKGAGPLAGALAQQMTDEGGGVNE